MWSYTINMSYYISASEITDCIHLDLKYTSFYWSMICSYVLFHLPNDMLWFGISTSSPRVKIFLLLIMTKLTFASHNFTGNEISMWFFVKHKALICGLILNKSDHHKKLHNNSIHSVFYLLKNKNCSQGGLRMYLLCL